MGKKNTIGKKEKLVLTFDDDARKDYLTGFRKRKEERKNKAHLEIEKKLKQQVRQERNKRRKTTQEKVEKIMANVNLFRPDENEQNTESQVVEFEDHEVEVKTDVDFSQTGLIITNNDDQEDSAKKMPLPGRMRVSTKIKNLAKLNSKNKKHLQQKQPQKRTKANSKKDSSKKKGKRKT